jgi:hypothetical protein
MDNRTRPIADSVTFFEPIRRDEHKVPSDAFIEKFNQANLPKELNELKTVFSKYESEQGSKPYPKWLSTGLSWTPGAAWLLNIRTNQEYATSVNQILRYAITNMGVDRQLNVYFTLLALEKILALYLTVSSGTLSPAVDKTFKKLLNMESPLKVEEFFAKRASLFTFLDINETEIAAQSKIRSTTVERLSMAEIKTYKEAKAKWDSIELKKPENTERCEV